MKDFNMHHSESKTRQRKVFIYTNYRDFINKMHKLESSSVCTLVHIHVLINKECILLSVHVIHVHKTFKHNYRRMIGIFIFIDFEGSPSSG